MISTLRLIFSGTLASTAGFLSSFLSSVGLLWTSFSLANSEAAWTINIIH